MTEIVAMEGPDFNVCVSSSGVLEKTVPFEVAALNIFDLGKIDLNINYVHAGID